MLAEAIVLQITCIQMPVIHDINKVNKECKLFQTSISTFITST